jgi:hypothetical protein
VLSLLTIALTWTAAAGCQSVAAPGPRAMRTVAKGAVSGITETKQEIIRDATAWETIWRQHCRRAKPAEPPPDINFGTDMVIVATLGTRQTGGYAIEIASVEETEGLLRITVKRTAPPKGAMTIQVITAPFHMVTVPRSDRKPEFVVVEAAVRK